MKSFRLNRLFNARSQKCFDVAVDHGFFDDVSFLAGIENLEQAVRTLVEAGPDAIQLTQGQAHLLQSIPGKQKPALVLRVDTANIYGKTLPDVRYNTTIADPIETAVRMDASCICINLFKVPGAPEIQQQCVENILSVIPQAHRYGMPVMIEPLVARDYASSGGYMVDGDAKKIIPLVRQAVELGADVIKADPTENVADYPRCRSRRPDSDPRPRRWKSERRGNPQSHRSPFENGNQGNCLRPQRHSAPRPGRHHQGADVDGSRERNGQGRDQIHQAALKTICRKRSSDSA